jgi:hypothetical protein
MRKTWTIVLVGFFLMLQGCSSFYLPDPSNSESTILVLPFTVTNKAERSDALGFHFIYEIERLDNTMEPVEVRFTRKMDADILTIATLLPGVYRVRGFNMVPAGTGDHSYDNQYVELDLRFSLETGKITIFMRSLNLEIYNDTPGRGSETTYSIALDDVTPGQFEEITRALANRPSFKHWEIRTEPPQVEDDVASMDIDSYPPVATDCSYCGSESVGLKSECAGCSVSYPSSDRASKSGSIRVGRPGNRMTASVDAVTG